MPEELRRHRQVRQGVRQGRLGTLQPGECSLEIVTDLFNVSLLEKNSDVGSFRLIRGPQQHGRRR